MTTVLEALARLSSAEQFFHALDVEFDQKVLDVNRLHILKRFHDLIDLEELQGLPAPVVEAACRAALSTAYEEFAHGKGTKTFKVFTSAPSAPGFVPLSAVAPADK